MRSHLLAFGRESFLFYIFHEATTNQWKTAILLSSGKGDDITSTSRWKTVLFVSRWAHEADTLESFLAGPEPPQNLPTISNSAEVEGKWKLCCYVTNLRYPHVHDPLYRQNVAPENTVRTSPVPSVDLQ